MDNSELILKLRNLPRSGRASVFDDLEAMKTALGSLTSVQNNTVLGTQLIIEQNHKLLKSYEAIAAPMMQLEMRSAALQKQYGLNIEQAGAMGYELDKMAESFGTGGRHMRKYALNLKGIIGNFTTAKTIITETGRSMLYTQRMLTDKLGVTDKAAQEYEFYSSTIADKSSDQLVMTSKIAKEIEGITGQQGLFKEIVSDIGSLTADLQIQYGRIPGQLELGLVKAKALGLTMQNLSNAGKNLLNIESSIGQELEYQLLSGKRLVDNDGKSLTNKYRIATLSGKASDQADVLNDILESEGDTLKDNLFARQQMSQLLGMDEAALSRALQKKSILEDLPGGDALFDKTGDELISAAKAMGATEGQLKELQETEDKRQTPDILSDIKDLMITDGIKTIPAGTTQDISQSLIKGMTDFADVIEAPSKTMAVIAGEAKTFHSIAKESKKLFDEYQGILSGNKDVIEKLTGVIAASDATFGVSTTGEVNVNEAAEDFIFSQGQITPFHPGDQLVGGKDGGPILDAISNSGTNIDSKQIGMDIANAIYNVLKEKQVIKIVPDLLFSGQGGNNGAFA